MENFIVRLRTYYKDEYIRCGTGVAIGDREVLTAAHVACGDRHTVVMGEKEIPLSVVQTNDVATVLRAEQPLPFGAADIFSADEILNTHALWEVNGYITEEQCAHQMTGRGIVYADAHDTKWDHYLATVDSGRSNDYQGLSGSPVLSCGRIVGILQMQAPNGNGSLGVRMASVGMFRKLLPADRLQPNEYETLIWAESQAFSCGRVDENKTSRKYIPDIFVEEELYKEQLRYFADPCQFVKRTIRDCRRIDFSAVNRYLSDLTMPEIGFSGLPEEFSPDELDEMTEMLSHRLSYAADALKTCREHGERNGISIERYFGISSEFNNSLRYYLKDLQELVGFARLHYLLLTKRAGQGKTNFLCDFTENFLMKKGYCVWYFNAYELHGEPMRVLQRRLSMQGRYDPAYAEQVLERAWKRTGRPMVVVIDGLNENTVIPRFGDCICGFLEECSTLPYLKVIMSTRKELLEERFGGLLRFGEQTAFQHLDMKETDHRFKERIFNGYLHFFDIAIRWNTLTPRTFDLLTKDVLLLRFFCEVNEHKRQIYMYDIYKYDVFEQYLVKKAQEYQPYEDVVDARELFYSLLDHICKHMIENKAYFQVPLGTFDRDQQWLLKRMLENEVIFKGEELIENGILQRNSVVISFTFDEFRDFCLTNYVLSHHYRREEFLGFWNTMQQENQTIHEGMQKYIFYLSKTKYRDKLLPLVQELAEYETLYWEYIWDVEDQYISEEDAARWKAQMLQGGEHAGEAVEHLLAKYDCAYFAGTNIGLLFQVLDELAGEINRYNRFVKAMFGVTRRDNYAIDLVSRQSVVPFDNLLDELRAGVGDNEWEQKHRELFRLVIYLYELAVPQAQALWDELYQTSPETVVGLLKEMNGHADSLIKGNVKDILLGLLERPRSDEYDLEVDRLNAENEFGQGMVDVARSIAGIFGEGL